MEGSVTDDLAHQWLQDIADEAWVSLHYDVPTLGTNEISGGGYLRCKVPFSQPANRTIWSLGDARFTGLDQGQLTHFGIWNSRFNGLLMCYAHLPERKAIMNGDGYIIREGDLAVSLG